MAGSKRTIIESKLFATQRAAIQPYVRLWDQFSWARDLTLSANPEAGERVYGLDLWIVTTEPSSIGMPRLRIAYQFDGDTVTLLGIEVDRS